MPRFLFLLIFGFSIVGLSSFAWAQTASRAKTKKAVACKDEPFAYDNGPFGQGSWCDVCNATPPPLSQAPINITGAQRTAMDPIQFDYDPNTPLRLLPNANNMKVEGKGSITIPIQGFGTFNLKEFHFHRPSEEAIENRRSAMVIHLVHENTAQTQAVVVSVLVEEGNATTDPNPVIETLTKHFPPPLGLVQGETINPKQLLPSDPTQYYRLAGSLTTPPCTQGITFFVLKNPIQLPAEQIRQFARRYPLPNARDIQNTNGRPIFKNFPD
jgi:carbonic anhydrase